eukprot:363880-Chlamydomonas_euryale.AAC.11
MQTHARSCTFTRSPVSPCSLMRSHAHANTPVHVHVCTCKPVVAYACRCACGTLMHAHACSSETMRAQARPCTRMLEDSCPHPQTLDLCRSRCSVFLVTSIVGKSRQSAAAAHRQRSTRPCHAGVVAWLRSLTHRGSLKVPTPDAATSKPVALAASGTRAAMTVRQPLSNTAWLAAAFKGARPRSLRTEQ